MTTPQPGAAPTPLDALARIGGRFQGVDLKFRRGGVDWPAAWRAECFSAKHEGVRLHAHGDTPEAAIQALQVSVDAWDGRNDQRGNAA